jgi:hypothetical protein
MKFTLMGVQKPTVSNITFDPDTTLIYAIGDVHGCLDELKELVEKCEQDAIAEGKTAKVILLGDVIDRGPHFLDVFKYINEKGLMCIMGNHEYNFWLENMGAKECRSKARRANHDKFAEYKKSDQKMIIDTICKMPNVAIAECESTGAVYVFSHSPIRNIELGIDVPNYTLPECAMRSDPIDYDLAQQNIVQDNVTFVHGHQSWNFKLLTEQYMEQLFNRSLFFNLDSGVVYGRTLTAACLNTKKVLEVKAREVYDEND